MKYFFSAAALLGCAESFSPSKLLNQRHYNAPLDLASDGQGSGRVMMMLYGGKIGIYFGTSTGSTQHVAELIYEEFGEDANEPIEIDDIQGSVAEEFSKFDALVVGTPTWNTGADSERSGTGWDEIYYGEMNDLNLGGKKVAVFGLGDQVSYCENYADATGELHDVFQGKGCRMMGYTSTEGYEHDASKALRGDQFCGLLCDEVNQDDLTEERVQNWVAQLKAEGILDGGNEGGVIDAEVAPISAVEEDIASPVNGQRDLLAELEEENARLRKLLEDSNVMDKILKSDMLEGGYVPHYNPKTMMTMWTSSDGRKCYYTTKEPQMSP